MSKHMVKILDHEDDPVWISPDSVLAIFWSGPLNSREEVYEIPPSPVLHLTSGHRIRLSSDEDVEALLEAIDINVVDLTP